MDIEWMRSVMTVVAFVTFVGIVIWAWSARKRADFDAAAHAILADNDNDARRHGLITSNHNRGCGNE